MGESFENRDMAEATFRKVDLRKAVFDDVNLGGATIHNANLSNVSIDDANIKGMTIFGMRVDQLIADELDRRDPKRVRLRMKDLHDPESVCAVMEHLEQLRGEFREMLRSTPADVLVTRPGTDEWSAIEHVRHLVFAKDLYLNRWLLRNDKPWNKLGLLPAFLMNDHRYSDVGSQSCNDLETVLAAWNDIHAGTRKFLADLSPEKLLQATSDVDFGQGTTGGVLQGLALHDLHHIGEVEAAIAKQDRKKLVFRGLLLKESLKDERFLDGVRVSKIEVWDVENAVGFQPEQWTAVSFEGDQDQADLTAEKLSQAIKPAWYANFSSEMHVYVVFAGKFFKYAKGDKQARTQAQQYALSVGISEHELDWGE